MRGLWYNKARFEACFSNINSQKGILPDDKTFYVFYQKKLKKAFLERSFVILFHASVYKRLKRVTALIFSLFFLSQVLLGSIIIAQPAHAAAQAGPAAAIPDTEINPYGTNTFLDKEVEYWKKERTMQMINQAGIKWIKQIFGWNEIEFKKGYFNDDKNKKSGWQKYDEIVDLAAKYDIQIVARIDQTPAWANPVGGVPGGHPANFQDYADFLKAFVEHYKGKVKYITVWNEPNLEREWEPTKKVNPAQYVEMLKVAYKAIKDTDPTVKVMAAPLAITLEKDINLDELTYLDEMYQAGAKDYFDIMPANAYGLEFPPEAAPDPKVLNYRRVELLHEIMVKNGDTNKAVWFNEYGWNASPASIPADKLTWRRVTEQQQADYTVQGIDYARKNWPWAGVIFTWFFRQVGDIPDTSSEQYFQMVTKDFVPKPVYDEVKQSAYAYLQQQGLPTPAPITPAVPATSTPIPGATTAARPATVPGTPAAPTTPGATVVAQVSQTGSATPTVQPPKATSTPASSNPITTVPITTDDNSILLPIIIGILLVVVAGGGLAAWLVMQRRRP
jgi:polysaccharide biosynthesis protein PslG